MFIKMFYIIRTKIYNSVMTLYYYMSAIESILFVLQLYKIMSDQTLCRYNYNSMVETQVIYSKLRLFLYMVVIVTSPMWMNMVAMCAFVVERLINIFGELAYLYSNVYQVINQVYQFQLKINISFIGNVAMNIIFIATFYS